MPNPSDPELRRLITSCRRIAVIGYSSQPAKAGSYVPAYLRQHGYEIFPVNPKLAASDPNAASADLAALPSGCDMVLIFRQSALVPGHLPDILALQPPPALVWLQLGIRSSEARQALEARGIRVVEDLCLKVEHSRLCGG